MVSNSHANVFLVDQVVQMIAQSRSELSVPDVEVQRKGGQKGAPTSSSGYPYKIVEEYFLKLVRQVLTLDGKNSTVKLVVEGLGKIYERLAKKQLLREKSQPAHKLVTKIISHLCEVRLLPNLSAALQTRSALMLTQVMVITKKQFKLKCRQTLKALQGCVVMLLAQTQKQALQISGIQIGVLIYDEDHLDDEGNTDVVFRHLMLAL